MSEAAPEVVITAGGDATDEEVAAVMAAVSLFWSSGGGAPAPEPTPRWRFSGRWWTKPIPARRDRP